MRVRHRNAPVTGGMSGHHRSPSPAAGTNKPGTGRRYSSIFRKVIHNYSGQLEGIQAPRPAELAGGIAGHLLAWERHERDRSWWAWVPRVYEAGSRRNHKVVLVRADSLRPLEPPEAYTAVTRGCLPRWQIRGYELTTPDDNNRVSFHKAHPQARTRIDLADLRQAAARIQLIRMRSVG
jgi:hypothetical protein